jgi:hypothetical protein
MWLDLFELSLVGHSFAFSKSFLNSRVLRNYHDANVCFTRPVSKLLGSLFLAISLGRMSALTEGD